MYLGVEFQPGAQRVSYVFLIFSLFKLLRLATALLVFRTVGCWHIVAQVLTISQWIEGVKTKPSGTYLTMFVLLN